MAVEKTEEEELKRKERELIEKMLTGEVSPTLEQAYKLIKNSIDKAIVAGVYNAADNTLIVRAFDTFRKAVLDSQAAKEAEPEAGENAKSSAPPRKHG